MAHENKVLKSINTPDGGRCVDIYRRPDATFGFEEFRRDTEDARGWFPIGHHAGLIFETQEAAFTQAKAKVPWLADVIGAD
ncbi:MAG: hypothetical protein HQ512_00365 [Rhodospirillales bacterium]|nr:hypothetical protein [Rhodospirillales bacterium]